MTPGTGNANGNTIHRLKEGVERFFITDINNPGGSALAQSGLAVMWDFLSDDPTHFNHLPGGCNVLFMDGHVEFLKYLQPYGNSFPLDGGGLALHEFAHMDEPGWHGFGSY